jgi:hypothetical protein
VTVERAKIDRGCGPSKQIIVTQKQDCAGLALVHAVHGISTTACACASAIAAPKKLRPAGSAWGEHEETSMKQEEARRAVLSEYDRWAKKHPNDASMMGGFLFFRYLQEERSDLLDFRAVGNKWKIVHGWFRDRLKD